MYSKHGVDDAHESNVVEFYFLCRNCGLEALEDLLVNRRLRNIQTGDCRLNDELYVTGGPFTNTFLLRSSQDAGGQQFLVIECMSEKSGVSLVSETSLEDVECDSSLL